MMVFVPVWTVCSQDGYISGDNMLGIACSSLEEAKKYLCQHPNPDKGWGAGEGIREIVLDDLTLSAATTEDIERELCRRGQGEILRPLAERC
jgi:hypothetical protein